MPAAPAVTAWCGVSEIGECRPAAGVIVGSAVIEAVTPGDGGGFRWHLAGVERAATHRKPTRQPQPAWFRPF